MNFEPGDIIIFPPHDTTYWLVLGDNVEEFFFISPIGIPNRTEYFSAPYKSAVLVTDIFRGIRPPVKVHKVKNHIVP